MKTLYSKIKECDGAATPASTMGMGNPCAPGPDGSVGSGDMFPTEHTAKAKKEKKKKHLREGLLDDDFGMNDSFDDNILDSYIEQYGAHFKNNTGFTKDEYYKFFENFQIACKDAAGRFADSKSLMRAFRSKEVTIVIFKEDTPMSTRGGKGKYKKGIEVRRFIQNPLPEAIETSWSDDDNLIRCAFYMRVNHPQMVNIKNWKCYVCPADVYDKVYNACYK